jgi:DNA-binding CsgD family transcriptional regulator
MLNKNDFFSFKNSVTNISDNEYLQTSYYLESIKAFARLSNKSIYIIDYKEKGFEYVSDNPLLLCGHSAKEVEQMGYEFYFKYVTKKDLDLLLKINKIGFDFYEKIPITERIDYSISYDFHIINQEGKTILINQKLTPLFLTNEGKIWKALCLVSLSSSGHSGNIKIHKKGSQKILEYNQEKSFWESSISIKLSNREKEVLQLSIRGFKVDEIAQEIFLSTNTVKFHRKKLFEKLGVSNIIEAISFATNNGLI